jgi:CRISPR-associated protein Csm1
MTSNPAYRLAALLHDIGVIPARASGVTGDDTSVAERSARFLRERGHDDAADLVTASKETRDDRTDESPVTAPDSRERACFEAARAVTVGVHTDATDTEQKRLSDVFAVLTDSKHEGFERTYPLRPLTLDEGTIFPSTGHEVTSTAEQYENLWKGFTEELPPDPGYETVVNVLEKYAWCVPGRGTEVGLPLYDQGRTVAAVADALYGSELTAAELGSIAPVSVVDTDSSDHESSPKPLYTLVKGDISGIQAFIHRLRNPDEAQDRIARRTRGRSVQLWLLNEGLARLFCDRLGLPVTSLLWRGGGQFYALVPPGRETELEAFEAEVNEWMLDEFDGDILYVQGTATASDVTTEFSELFRQAAVTADENKLRKGSTVLASRDSAVLSDPREPCPACGAELTHGSERCVNCRIQQTIGQQLPRTDCLRLDYGSRTGDDSVDFVIDLPEDGLSWTMQGHPEDDGADVVLRLNDTTLPDVDPGVDCGFAFTGAEVPAGGAVDRVWSFGEIRQLGSGSADLMHVAKLDIDGLGAAIRSGMSGGPARLAALSRGLEVFFSGQVNSIAQNQSFYYDAGACGSCRETLSTAPTQTVDHTPYDRTTNEATYYRVGPEAASTLHEECVDRISPVYIAFSGGDDMLFAGPWDEAIEFARDVHSTFADYANEELSLSGGFFLTRPKYPIGRAAEEAEERLSVAKKFERPVGDDRSAEQSSGDDGPQASKQRKNAAHLFGETRGWEHETQPDVESLLRFGRRLEELVNEGSLSRSLLHSLLTVQADVYPDLRSERTVGVETTRGKQKEWRIKYMLARNFEGELMEELEQKVPTMMPWLGVSVGWASLATR